MALHPNFPKSPYAPLIPEQRWFPEDETLRATADEKLLPPLVAKIRTEVYSWRNQGYPGASSTSASLLRHWFETEHLVENADGSLSTFLEAAPDVQAFSKNYLAVGFKLDYVKANGDLANDTPDFIVRSAGGPVWIVETKGRAELDLPQKMARLKQWCADATAAEDNGQRYDFVFVDQTGFEKHGPKTFAGLAASFTEYK
jgi:hypothetical protein